MWCASRGGLITASNTKGQKEVEKGLKGNLNTNNPFSTFRPLSKKAQSNGLLWVTISYYEQSDIINKKHRNPQKLI